MREWKEVRGTDLYATTYAAVLHRELHAPEPVTAEQAVKVASEAAAQAVEAREAWDNKMAKRFRALKEAGEG
jgi:hypothetical protein